MSKSQAVASASGSVRAEGLEPSAETLAVMQAWADGRLSDEEFRKSERRAFAGEPMLPVHH